MDGVMRELVDPITLELLEDPITVPCCTKAFSRASLVRHLQEGGSTRTCPSCHVPDSLRNFDATTAPRNVVLASLADNFRFGGPSNGGGATATSDDHQWQCTLTPVATTTEHDDDDDDDDDEKAAAHYCSTAELVLSCRKSKFRTRPSLFVAVVDESGSMTGRPMEQVRTALRHMEALARTNPQVELKIISYSSGAVEIDDASEYGTRVGGTNFVSAFAAICHLLDRYQCSDRPEDAHVLNNVSSVSVAFLTDGQDGSGVGRDRLVPEFRAMLEKIQWVAAAAGGRDSDDDRGTTTNAAPPPLAVHAVGFGGDCDRELLEAMRLAGNAEGLFRYADPQDDGDTLCNKLTDLFELSSRASSVPVRLQIGGDGDNNVQELRFPVDSLGHGEHKQWIRVDDRFDQVVVNSALDDNLVVPVHVRRPTQAVFQRWLSKCADQLASDLLELVRGETDLTDKVRRLYCAVLEHQIGVIAQKADGQNSELLDRVAFLKTQVQAIRAGTQIQLGKLSDLRFASLFAAKKSADEKATTATAGTEIRTLPPAEIPRLDVEEAFERPLQKRYSRSNQGTDRTPLQKAIVDMVADRATHEIKEFIDQSSMEDMLATDKDGNTALMLAAYCGHSTVVAEILKKHPNIDLEMTNPEGETALTLAIKKRGFHHSMGALLEAGASIPRRKAMERFCIDNGYVITAQIVAQYGESSLEVDESMTPEYVQFVYERARKTEDKPWDKEQFLNVALSKEMTEMCTNLLEEGVQPTIEMLVNHCIPPKPDHPEYQKYLDLAELLLKHRPGLIFEKTEKEQESALFAAARRGSEPHVQHFIRFLREQSSGQSQFENELEAPNNKGNTPLWVASFMRYPCIMDVLLDHGADVNHHNTKGNPPLYGVCCRGPAKVAEQLIRRGAKVDDVLKTGDTHILLCCRNGTSEVLKTLLNYVDEDFVNMKAPIDGFNAVMAAAEQDHADCIRVLHEYGVDLDQLTDEDNQILQKAAPLHIAAYYDRIQAAQALLELGANPDVQDIHGLTPMHLSVIQANTSIIELLRGYSNLQIKDNAGYTPIAYCRNNQEIEKLLVNPLVGPLVELAKGGYSAEEEKAAIAILRACGIPGVVVPGDFLDVSDFGGTSVLSHAVVNVKRELVEAMVELGVTCGHDMSGMHVMTWAKWTRNRRIVRIFEKGGAADDAVAKKQIEKLEKEMRKTVSNDLLFPGPPPPYEPDPASSIGERMELFVNAPCPSSSLREPFAEDLPKLIPGDSHVDRYFDEEDLREIKNSRQLWQAKLDAVRQIACGTPLDAAELMALSVYTSNAKVSEVLGRQLLLRDFSSEMVKDYVSVLYGGLCKLLPYEGEAFLAAPEIDRNLFLKGREFTWNRFVSASSLWRVALENVPTFTSKVRKGVVFLIKSKTGRALPQSFDAEVLFLPNTRFVVSNWYHGDVIALRQENIREHTFGIKEEDTTQRPNLRQVIEGDTSLIIELKELSPFDLDVPPRDF